MKGRNTLLLNTATIMDAVQEYLDKRLVADPDKIGDNRVRVTSITATAINNAGTTGTPVACSDWRATPVGTQGTQTAYRVDVVSEDRDVAPNEKIHSD